MHQDNNDHLAVSKKTHTQRKLTVRTELASSVPRMSNRIKFVNCVGCNSKCYFKFGKSSPNFFQKFHHVRKVHVKYQYHCYFVEHSFSKGNNQGTTKKNGIPAALKRGQNTNSFQTPRKIIRNNKWFIKRSPRGYKEPFTVCTLIIIK